MDNAELIRKHNEFRGICLKNAQDLLAAAKATLDAGIDHASFHLSVLALEEIGKIEIERIRAMSEIHPRGEPIRYRLDTEDHERKLFFAIWAPSLGRHLQTKTLLYQDVALAKSLHGNRLAYLYSDPANPHHWRELMREGEAKKVYDLVESRVKVEENNAELNAEHAAAPDENLLWFLNIQEDEERRREIWGQKSQEKLLELGSVKSWIEWLRSVYDKHEKDMRDLMQREIDRTEPPESEKLENKWRIKIEIVTPSHSIRQQNLNEFNERSNWIKLHRKDAHTLRIEFLHSKNIPVQGLFHHGWGVARMFVAALNIGTHGFFWWNIKRDPARYYEEIWDLQNNVGVRIQVGPELEINWRETRFVLKPLDLSMTSLMFAYIADCLHKKDRHLNEYGRISPQSIISAYNLGMRGQFGIRSLRKRFPTEDACLEYLFRLRHSRQCSCGGAFKRVTDRRKYQCGRCRTQVSPTASTIFEKSRVPLTLWFHCMLVFSNAKCGISAKVIERDLEVTYKCAWRMLTLIRSKLPQSEDVLFGDVEVDTGYIGGKAPLERRMRNKATVFGAIQRRGQARVEVTRDAGAEAHKNFIWKNVSTKDTRLLTDKANRFHVVAKPYNRQFVNHSKNEYARGDVHVNNIENFWSHVKRSISGTHRRVSKRYLQSYLDGFVFHYNNARTDRERFFALLDTVLRPPTA